MKMRNQQLKCGNEKHVGKEKNVLALLPPAFKIRLDRISMTSYATTQIVIVNVNHYVEEQRIVQMIQDNPKMLLGVRPTTVNDLCLVELGLPPLQALVRHKQKLFFRKMFEERQTMDDDPFMFAMKLTRTNNMRMARCIAAVLGDVNHIGISLNSIKEKIATSNGTKYMTYYDYYLLFQLLLW